jgi:hypothetical protein
MLKLSHLGRDPRLTRSSQLGCLWAMSKRQNWPTGATAVIRKLTD